MGFRGVPMKWITRSNSALLVCTWLLVGVQLCVYGESLPLEALYTRLVVGIVGVVATLCVWEHRRSEYDLICLGAWLLILIPYTLLPLCMQHRFMYF